MIRPDRLPLLRAEAERRWAEKLARVAASEDLERQVFPGRFCTHCGARRDGTAAAHRPDCPRSLGHWAHRRGRPGADTEGPDE